MTIGSNIRWIRLLTGMTQEEFAELVGATKATLYTYESGRTVPNELILSKIAAIAGITISELEWE